jgi:hypothetical protein
VPGTGADQYLERPCPQATDRPTPTVTVAPPPGALDPGWFDADHRFDPLVCVDDRGHYLGVLRIEQLVHRLLAGPRP